MTDPTRLHAHEMARLLRDRQISSRELTEAHLAAAERDNHGLNAWLSIDRERALAEADDADMRLETATDDPAHALDRLQPPVAAPRPRGAWPAAPAAAEPPLEPPGTRSRSHGLAVGPNAECSVDEPIANSSMLVLPRMTAPAARRRSVMCASYGAR